MVMRNEAEREDEPATAEERRRPARRMHPGAALAWGLFAAALILGWVFAPDEAAVRAAFERLGPLAPAVYVLLEVVQVVIAPIPGQPIEIPGGWFFGLAAGAALGTAGAFVGSMIAFRLARRFGRPWVEARLSAKNRGRIQKHLESGSRTEWAVFLLMLVPSFPRDPLCYMAGLTGMSARRFAVIAAIGRPVGMLPWVALGAEGVAVGIEVQLWLAAAAGAVWLAHKAQNRLRGRRPRSPDANSTVASPQTFEGERYA